MTLPTVLIGFPKHSSEKTMDLYSHTVQCLTCLAHCTRKGRFLADVSFPLFEVFGTKPRYPKA